MKLKQHLFLIVLDFDKSKLHASDALTLLGKLIAMVVLNLLPREWGGMAFGLSNLFS